MIMTKRKLDQIERIRKVRRRLNRLPESPPRQYIHVQPNSPTNVLPDKFKEIDGHTQELYMRIDELEELILGLMDRK